MSLSILWSLIDLKVNSCELRFLKLNKWTTTKISTKAVLLNEARTCVGAQAQSVAFDAH